MPTSGSVEVSINDAHSEEFAESGVKTPMLSPVVTVKRSTFYATLFIVVLTFVALAGAVVGLLIYGPAFSDDDDKLAPTLKPTMSPTSQPTLKPTMAPTEADRIIEIKGAFGDGWGSEIVINNDYYQSQYPGYGKSFINITFFDNTMKFLVGQNSGPGSYNPGKWSRIDWHIATEAMWGAANAGKVAYCTTLYNAESEMATMLLDTQPGGAVDPRIYDYDLAPTTGCGGFAFSILTPTP